MFRLRNKKNSFLVHTLIWRPIFILLRDAIWIVLSSLLAHPSSKCAIVISQCPVSTVYRQQFALTDEQWHEISNNGVCATSKGSDLPAHTCRLIRAFASLLNILWLLSYWTSFGVSNAKARLTPTLVKMPHCWKSHVAAYMTTPPITRQICI